MEDWRRLFTAGADTATEKNGVASLIFACDKGHVEVAQLLLEAGINKNSAGILRDTPLMRASSKGHIEVVRLLVAAGVNMDFLSRISQHAGHDGFASLDGPESLHLLMEFFLDQAPWDNREGDVFRRCKFSFREGGGVKISKMGVGLVNLARKFSGPMCLLDGGSNTALMHACAKGHVEIVRLLVEAGANCDLKSTCLRSETALMLASRAGHIEAARVLLEAGAHKDLKDSRGNTALMCACEKGHAGIMRLLLEAGADKELKNNRGKTALMCAEEQGKVELVQLLEAAISG